MLAVAEAEEADLVAFEELLDEDVLLGLAQQLAAQQVLGGFEGGVARRTDDDALTGMESVSLDHDGRMKEFDGLLQFGQVRADRVAGCGNVVPLQESLGETLAGLQHGRGPRGPEDAQAAFLQGVHNAQRERQLRPHDGQPRLFGLGQTNHCSHVF